MQTRAIVSTLLAAAGVAVAQPSQLPPPIPTPNVPGGNDAYGFPFLAPGAFPDHVYAGVVKFDHIPGYDLDGTNSNYLRMPYDPSQGMLPIGAAYTGSTNEGDFDPNLSPNAGLLDCSLPDDRCAYAFPNTNWDIVFGVGGQASFPTSATGEPSYAWAATAGAGVLLIEVAQNGRDNDARFSGQDAGTLYATAHSTPNDFRGGAGYNMLTGELASGNGTMYASFNAVGGATEYIIDVAPVWFPFIDGWTAGTTFGGTLAWNDNTVAPDPVTMADVSWPSRSANLPEDASQVIQLAGDLTASGSVDLSGLSEGAATPANSMLFIEHCGDSNDDKILNIKENGDVWSFVVRFDSDLDPSGLSGIAAETDTDIAFVAIPYASQNLVGGKINADGSVANGVGGFTMSQDGANPGRYYMTIDGSTTQEGTVLLQPIGAALGDADLPGRAFMSYEYDEANGRFVIEAHEAISDAGANVFNESYPLISTPFYVAYTSFANPIAPPSDDTCVADITGEGDVNTNDFFAFLALYQAQDARADITGEGDINTNDFFAYLAAYQDALNNGC